MPHDVIIQNSEKQDVIKNAVSNVNLKEIKEKDLDKVKRYVITVDGSESEDEIESIKNYDADMLLLKIRSDISRVHVSRKIFEILQKNEIDVPVIHYIDSDLEDSDKFIINCGTQVQSYYYILNLLHVFNR